MKVSAQADPALADVHEAFCSAFERRDVDGVMRLLAPDSNTTVVTSEESLLRGLDEIQVFMDSYVAGPTTYSWSWDRCQVSSAGAVGWLLAEGTETAETADRREVHPYRMTMVFRRHGDDWLLVQVHGSSPYSP